MSAANHRESDDDGTGAHTEPKKHHFTPLELQRKQLDKLLEKIDKPVHIPERPGQKQQTPREPKNYVKNVQGSSAGAGSGEFHVYRAGRRREYARLKNMELESKEAREQREYDEKMRAKRAADEDKTEKNRSKRQRRKQRASNNKLSKSKEGDGSDGEEDGRDVEENRRSSREPEN